MVRFLPVFLCLVVVFSNPDAPEDQYRVLDGINTVLEKELSVLGDGKVRRLSPALPCFSFRVHFSWACTTRCGTTMGVAGAWGWWRCGEDSAALSTAFLLLALRGMLRCGRGSCGRG